MPQEGSEKLFNPLTFVSEGKTMLLQILERDLRRKERQRAKEEKAALKAKATAKAKTEPKRSSTGKKKTPADSARPRQARSQRPRSS